MDKKHKYLLLILICTGSLGLFVYNYVHFYREATCTEPKTCSLCGKEEGSPLGHQYGEWVILEEPDCLSYGKRERECSIDGYKESEVIPALGHDWHEATYDTPKTCSRCGETEGHVKGYISREDISEEWSEDRITLGGNEGVFCSLENPLLRCMNITIRFKLYEYTADVSGRWTFWTRDGSGNWHDSGDYYFDDVEEMTETQKIDFEFSNDIDIYAYRFSMNESKDYSWNYSYGSDIAEAQVREE